MFGGSMRGSVSGTPAPEKKPATKKRKSWGQQLPEPKTNLPPRYILDDKVSIIDHSANPLPRKRAKTEDEKEQRRVERVLRNRRAAQSSRERKRQEVEALEAQKMEVERQNHDLQMRLAASEERIALLQRELERCGGSMVVFGELPSVPASSPPQVQQLRQQSPVTFSQPLFTSNDDDSRPISTQSVVQSIPQPLPQTVNPASLSPEMRPVDESANASASDMTQHPAAVLCDLQCQSEEQRPWMDSTISRILAMTFCINMISAVTSQLLSPLTQICDSLRTGSVLTPTYSILTLIVWLTTTKASLTTSKTSTNSSTTTTSSRMRFSLRISLLRRLLACSPNLARPLMDATMEQLRSASKQQLSNDCLSSADAGRFGAMESPSVEALMTLLWATHVIDREREMNAKATELDAATEVRQACMELDLLFRQQRNMSGKSVVSFVSQSSHIAENSRLGQKTPESQKSLEGWRTA